jgi:hypothetical protein
MQILYTLCELTLYRCYLFRGALKLVTYLFCSRKLAFRFSSTLVFIRDIVTYLKLNIFFFFLEFELRPLRIYLYTCEDMHS